jgi:DNA-binding response OmpR family regulator
VLFDSAAHKLTMIASIIRRAGGHIMKFQHILLVDEQPDVAETLRGVLEYCGYRVSIAGGDDDGRSILSQDSVDLLIADVALRSNVGITLADHAETLGIPSLLMSGDIGRMNALEAGPRPFIAKPFRLAKLTEVISGILAKLKA